LAWYNRGVAYKDSRQYAKAIADFSKAIELNADFAEARINRGSVYHMQRQLDKAIVDYSKAIELKPEFKEAWNNRASAYAELRQFDLALADFTQAIKLQPDDEVTWANRAVVRVGLRQYEEALADCAQAIKLQPKFDAAHNRLAWLLATCPDVKLRDPRRALESAKKAVELAPKQRHYWQTLAWAEYRAGNWKNAVTAAEKVEALGSASDSFEWFVLAMAHWQLGEKDKARSWYDRAVEWTDKNQPKDEELRRFRAEAAELLRVKEKNDRESGVRNQESDKKPKRLLIP
jgi:tetratricopeptide (TPR) repeat protein